MKANDKKKIVVCEDEYWIRQDIVSLLSSSPYDAEVVFAAQDGEEALAFIKENDVDILFTDINMPFVSGLELLGYVKENSPDTVSVVISGYDDFEYARSAMVSGVIDYLLKPVEKDRLYEVLLKACVKSDENKKIGLALEKYDDKGFSDFINEENTDEEYRNKLDCMFRKSPKVYMSYLKVFRDLSASETSSVKKIITDFFGSRLLLTFNNVYSSHEFIFFLNEKTDAQSLDLCNKIEGRISSFVTLVSDVNLFTYRDIRQSYLELKESYLLLPLLKRSCHKVYEKVPSPVFEPLLKADDRKALLYFIENHNREGFVLLLDEKFMSECQSLSRKEIILNLNDLYKALIAYIRDDALFESERKKAEDENILLPDDFIVFLADELFGTRELNFQSESMKEKILKVKEEIDGNCSQDYTLSYFADKYAVDASYLSRSFKEAMGVNLMSYIASARIEKAKSYMKERKLSIIDVSNLVGYDDYAYFNRVFKKVTGLSPRTYRESL